MKLPRTAWGALILLDAVLVLGFSAVLVTRVAGHMEDAIPDRALRPQQPRGMPAPGRTATEPGPVAQSSGTPSVVAKSTTVLPAPSAAQIPSPSMGEGKGGGEPAPLAPHPNLPPHGGEGEPHATSPADVPLGPSPAVPGAPPKARRTVFELLAPEAREVKLTGSFLKWEARPMTRHPDGGWRTMLFLLPGSYRYRFLVDGKPLPDPQNPIARDGLSILLVPTE